MKKLLLAAAALTALLTSCNEALEKPKRPVYDPKKEIICNIDQMPLAITKTGIDTKDYFQIWSEGDEISVLSLKGENVKFSLSSTSDDSPAFGIFTSDKEVNVADALYAVYPYSENCSLSGARITVDYPESIEFSEETGCAMGNNIMIAWNEGNDVFRFRNACALVKFELSGSVLVKQIVISRKDGEDIAGKGVINCGSPIAEVVVEEVSGSKTVTVNFGEDGKQLEKTPSSFVIGLAPVIDNGIVVKILTADGDEIVNEYEIKDKNYSSCINTITVFPSEDVKAPTVYIDGKIVNAGIKTLAQGKSCGETSLDSKVTKIEFKTGVDLSSLVGGVDVSTAGDGRVIATFSDGVATVSTDGKRFAADLSNMFRQFNALKSIEGLSSLIATRTESLDYTFAECKALESVDLSGFDFSKVISAAHTFENTAALSSLDVTSLASASPVSVAYLFSGCGASEITGVGSLNTEDCIDMSYMFNASSVASLDLSGWNTSSVITMERMFSETGSLEAIDITGFNTSNVTSMLYMFYKTALTGALDLSNFNTASLEKMDYMFSDAMGITSVNLGSFTTDPGNKKPSFGYLFKMNDYGYALTNINFGAGFTSLNGAAQNYLFPTYKSTMPAITVTCTLPFAQELLSTCTSRVKNSADLIKNGKLILKNLNGKEYTYTDKDGKPINVSAVTYQSRVVDPE